MNLRGKKENVQPGNVLKDKTNVRKSTEIKRKPVKRANAMQALKENNAVDEPLPAKKMKTTTSSTQRKKDPQSVISLTKTDVATKLPNSFGFSDEEDINASKQAYNGALTSFDCSKPYRLALYVRPSRGVRYDPKMVQQVQNWTTMNLSSIPLNTTNAFGGKGVARKRLVSETKMSPDRTQWKVPFSSTPLEKPSKTRKNPTKAQVAKATTAKKGKSLVQKKITDLILPPSPKQTRPANAKQQFKTFFDKSISSSEEELATTMKEATSSADEVASAEPAIEFPKPRLSGRWYEKRKKPEPLAEPEDEPPTEVILKELSKTKKTKSKKSSREEEEYEKWSATMNSEFSEVDQFDLSMS